MPRDLNRTLFIGLLFLIAPLAGCVSENEDSDAGGRTFIGGQNTDSASIKIAGSSTVYPLATGWIEDFTELNPDISASVALGGSGAGAAAVCSTGNDHVEIGSMSRTFKPIEATLVDGERFFNCKSSDIELTQVPIAMDGITIVLKRGGGAEQCVESIGGLSVAQLRWIFSDWTEDDLVYSQEGGLELSSITPNNDGDGVREWSDFSENPSCEELNINLWGPDSQSGTYEYFGEMIFCKKCFLGNYGYPEESFDSQRVGGYQNSANDNVIINGVSEDGAAIGFLGYSYYDEHQSELTAVGLSKNSTHSAMDGIEPIIQPTSDSIRSETYLPLSREIYMNVDNASWGTVLPFFEYAFSGDGQSTILEVGFVPLPESTFNETMAILNLHNSEVMA
jgi:phosphate transport system substrate-binding protein|tara:strand:- start:5688 stop:6866 length:1179 start_codon:yes stop_codon:yes gene_type:complete